MKLKGHGSQHRATTISELKQQFVIYEQNSFVHWRTYLIVSFEIMFSHYKFRDKNLNLSDKYKKLQIENVNRKPQVMLKLKAKLFKSTMAIKPFVDVDPERQLQWHFPILPYLKKLPPLCIKSYFLFYFSQLGNSFNRIVVKDRQFLSLRFLFLIKKFPIPQKLEQKIWISSTLNDFFPQKTSCSLQWRVEFFGTTKFFFPWR